MSWFIEDEKMLLEAEEFQEEFEKGFEKVTSGIYEVSIEDAYLFKSNSGATALQLKFKEFSIGRFIDIEPYWIISGDEKGNKKTYIDKNGNERPLPSWVEVTRLFRAIGMALKDAKIAPVAIERFGKKEQVNRFTNLLGKKLIAVIEAYENEWNGDVYTKLAGIDYLNIANPDEDKVIKYKKRFEKYPNGIKPLKGKKELSNDKDTFDGVGSGGDMVDNQTSDIPF